MHVREGYEDLDRRSWRVFMWSEGQCFGVPEVLGRDKNMRQILPDAVKEGLEGAQQVPLKKLFG